MAIPNLLTRLVLTPFELIIVYVATWYLNLSIHGNERILECLSGCFVSALPPMLATHSPWLRHILVYLGCWVLIWNLLFLDISAGYWTRMKTWQDGRYDSVGSVASWVFGAGIAVCSGMCDGVGHAWNGSLLGF
jgi:predicted MFS family arabinose efflux permease